MAHKLAHSAHSAHDHDVLEATAEWFSIMHADRISDEDRQNWHAWLAADPQHRAAWERVTRISHSFDKLPASLNARAANTALATLAAKPRRHALKLLGLACTVGLAGVLAARSRPVTALLAQYRTGVGQQRQLTLADGTSLWLNTSTALDVSFDGQQRLVHLLSGEIMIKTAADPQSPARPFLVATAQGTLRPLGTQFTVRADAGRSNVAVFEGAVEVHAADLADTAAPVVKAGSQMSFSQTQLGEQQTAEPMRRDWVHGVLVADNMRLGDFIAELARYHQGIFSCAPEVAELRIVGAFPVRDVEPILAALQATLPISIRQTTRWWIAINKKIT